MPIRTNRGRAAVYRRIWGFPLRTPRHLAGTVIVVAALIIAIGVVVPQLLGHRGGNGPTPAGVAGGSASSTPAPDSGADSTTVPFSTRLTAPLVEPSSAS